MVCDGLCYEEWVIVFVIGMVHRCNQILNQIYCCSTIHTNQIMANDRIIRM